MVSFDFAVRTSNNVFPGALDTCPFPWWTPAETYRGGLHNGSDARQSCACCHTRYRGTSPIFLRTSYGGLGEAQEEGYERSELLINKDKRIKRTFFVENRFISPA